MNRVLLWLAALAVSGTVVLVTARRALWARAALEQAVTAAETVEGNLSQARLLRASLSQVSVESTDSADLVTRVSEALASAGIRAAVLDNISTPTNSSVAGGGGGVVRRSASLTLQGLTLPQVGQFLAARRSREPAWVPTRIDLVPSGGRSSENAPVGGDLPLRATITLESISSHAGVPRR